MGALDFNETENVRSAAGRDELPRLTGSVGRNGANGAADVALVLKALASIGVDDGPRSLAWRIEEGQRRLARITGDATLPDDGLVTPDGPTAEGYRQAVIHNRLPVRPAPSPGDPHQSFRAGLMRARRRSADGPAADKPEASRARLPPVDPAVYVENRRLARALRLGAGNGRIDRAIALSLAEGGRQGFVNVRDFVEVLSKHDAPRARKLVRKASRRLRGPAKALALKLLEGKTPSERDFT